MHKASFPKGTSFASPHTRESASGAFMRAQDCLSDCAVPARRSECLDFVPAHDEIALIVDDELFAGYLGGGADVVELRKVDVHGSLLAQTRLLGELVCPRLDGLEQVLGGELALERVGVCVDIAQNALAGLEQLGDPGQRTL